MSRLFCCLFSYKVTTFLDFFVANMFFLLAWRNIYVLNPAAAYLLRVNNEYDKRNYGISSKLTIKTLEQSQLTSVWYLLALIRLQKFLKSLRKSNWNRIEIFGFSRVPLGSYWDPRSRFSGFSRVLLGSH